MVDSEYRSAVWRRCTVEGSPPRTFELLWASFFSVLNSHSTWSLHFNQLFCTGHCIQCCQMEIVCSRFVAVCFSIGISLSDAVSVSAEQKASVLILLYQGRCSMLAFHTQAVLRHCSCRMLQQLPPWKARVIEATALRVFAKASSATSARARRAESTSMMHFGKMHLLLR